MPQDLQILATDDFEIVSRRLELLARSTTTRDLIKVEIEREYQKLLALRKSELSKQERRIEFAETIILAIAGEHPEWFTGKRTLTTPFGSVHAHATTSHKVIDEAHTIRLIETAAARTDDEAQRARLLGLIRVKKEVDLEACEGFSPKELTALRVVRIHGTSLSIKLAKAAAGKKGKSRKKLETPEDVAAAA